MALLALDTSGTIISIALFSTTRELVAARNHRTAQTSEEVLPLAIDVLNMGGVKAQAIENVAVALGPGSFTGIRTGIATALGFLNGQPEKLLGVPTLEARVGALLTNSRVTDAASITFRGADTSRVLVPVLGANDREFFYTLLIEDRSGGGFRTKSGYCGVIPRADYLSALVSAHGEANYELMPVDWDVLECEATDPAKKGPAASLGRWAVSHRSLYAGRHAPVYGKRVNALTLAERGFL